MTKSYTLFKLDDRPPLGVSSFVGLQHLLASFGGLVTAPWLIASGMGLTPEQTTYLIGASLVVSGFGTLIQVLRIGRLGSGMLSIQGTSFAFIGPMLFLHGQYASDHTSAEILGMIFGACLICSLIVMIASQFLKNMANVITANVTGATVILLGLTLVWTTLGSLWREYQSAGSDGWMVWLLSGVVFAAIILVVRLGGTMLRISSIVIGLMVGLLLAVALGAVDLTPLQDLNAFFVPTFNQYPLAIDLTMVLVLLPIFVISATESIGDLTATAELSGVELGTPSFWQRLQGGVLAGAVSSFVAALLSTFPSTTFSQNNGVIRLTGVCSRHIGVYVAVFLCLVGMVPMIGAGFQILPPAVLYGATLLMFVMVGVSGYYIVRSADPSTRDWAITLAAVLGGLLVSSIVSKMNWLPATAVTVFSFPVSTGAFLAMLLEICLPKNTATDKGSRL